MSHVGRIRFLTISLIGSTAVNLALISFLVYFILKERPPIPYCELKPATLKEQAMPLASRSCLSENLRDFLSLSYKQLLGELKNTQLVESGYKKRDLALAVLVAHHQLDLERALSSFGERLEKRKVLLKKLEAEETPFEITLYPGLKDDEFHALSQFARVERCPFTSEGLFRRLKETGLEQSLVEAFSFTPEFMLVEMLFHRAGNPPEKKEMVEMLLEGSWEILAKFSHEQRTLHDLSSARRQAFLLQYIEQKSAKAAELFLATDGPFAVRKLDDEHVLTILSLLEKPTFRTEAFSLALLASPRSQAVWKAASASLSDRSSVPDSFFHIVSPERTVVKTTIQSHVVQDGECLWKIAKRYGVKLQELVQSNHLDEKVFLKPGMVLTIPSKKV